LHLYDILLSLIFKAMVPSSELHYSTTLPKINIQLDDKQIIAVLNQFSYTHVHTKSHQMDLLQGLQKLFWRAYTMLDAVINK
jgi:hypothetical protein